MLEPLSAAKRAFEKVFGPEGRVHVVRAPGRVNLIGEHVDYNDGFVLPTAVDPHVLVVCRTRRDTLIRLASTAFNSTVIQFDASKPITRGEPQWANYGRGVAAELIEAGIPLCGVDLLIDNTLPVGGGLSSSAAILVGMGLALLTIGGNSMDRQRLALLAQRAEHEYAGVPSGIMDQTIVACARAGHAMLLDCRDLSKHFVPLDSRELRIVIANTMVHHELSDGGYQDRVNACRRGAEFFASIDSSVKSLRDVNPELLKSADGKLDAVILRRCRHVVTEIARAGQAADLLSKRRYEAVGELMLASHQSLRTDYEVSCSELDFLVEESMKIRGVYGARMTGGGFGGCAVALVQPRSVDALIEQLKTAYKARFGIDANIFATSAAAGAGLLE